MEKLVIRTLFLLDIPRDHSERTQGDRRFSIARQGFPAVSGSPSCPRLQVPDPGLMRIACTDGEDRFGARSPATGSNLEDPGAAHPRARGAGSQGTLLCPGHAIPG